MATHMATLREDVRREIEDYRLRSPHRLSNLYYPDGHFYPYYNGPYGHPYRKKSASPVRKSFRDQTPASRKGYETGTASESNRKHATKQTPPGSPT